MLRCRSCAKPLGGVTLTVEWCEQHLYYCAACVDAGNLEICCGVTLNIDGPLTESLVVSLQGPEAS